MDALRSISRSRDPKLAAEIRQIDLDLSLRADLNRREGSGGVKDRGITFRCFIERLSARQESEGPPPACEGDPNERIRTGRPIGGACCQPAAIPWFAVHADLNTDLFQNVSPSDAGVLAALICVHALRPAPCDAPRLASASASRQKRVSRISRLASTRISPEA